MLLDCVVLVLLVLVQLPKKEAGSGLAFGGAASDALFGAGSGNVLTKITKYAAIAFFVLAVILSILQSNYHRRTTSGFENLLNQPARTTPGDRQANTPATPPAKSSIPPLTNIPQAEVSNSPAAANPPPTSTNTTAPK